MSKNFTFFTSKPEESSIQSSSNPNGSVKKIGNINKIEKLYNGKTAERSDIYPYNHNNSALYFRYEHRHIERKNHMFSDSNNKENLLDRSINPRHIQIVNSHKRLNQCIDILIPYPSQPRHIPAQVNTVRKKYE